MEFKNSIAVSAHCFKSHRICARCIIPSCRASVIMSLSASCWVHNGKHKTRGAGNRKKHIYVIKLETSQLTFIIIMTMNSAHVHSGNKKVSVVHHPSVVLPPSVVSLVVGCCTICPLSQRLRDPNSLQHCGETTV